MPHGMTDTLQRDAQQKMVDGIKLQCNRLLEIMRVARPTDAERIKSQLEGIIESCPKVPLDIKRKILADARVCECMANTRAADAALQAALSKARTDDKAERNRLVAEAQICATKAMALGAEASFKASVNRKVEIVMMTGNVRQ